MKEALVISFITVVVGVSFTAGVWYANAGNDKAITATMPSVSVAVQAPMSRSAEPRCLKDHRVHIYGTYSAPFGQYAGVVKDLTVDLYAVDCLEWERRP